MLARTASDPAPFGLPMSMSLDSTLVMPPLSLLPPLPSSRGRGRPPVPPATHPPAGPPSRPAAEGRTGGHRRSRSRRRYTARLRTRRPSPWRPSPVSPSRR